MSAPAVPAKTAEAQLAELLDAYRIWSRDVRSDGLCEPILLDVLDNLSHQFEVLLSKADFGGEELLAFRDAAWEYEPEEGDSGLERVGWLSALLAEVWDLIINKTVDLDAHLDPSASLECLSNVQHIRDCLFRAVQARRARQAP